jgi:sugar lactone lactonase YvrE
MKTNSACLLVDNRSAHGEGPVWDAACDRLLWVDLTGCKLNSLDPATGQVITHQFSEPVCAVAMLGSGGYLIAFAKRLARFDLLSGKIEEVTPVEPELPGNRCNDGKRDPAGRFWIGTMSQDGTVAGAGSLYRLENNGKLTRVLGELTIANGMGWTADGRTMFFIDSPTREVWAFDFEPGDSSISNQRTVVRVSDELGFPDGICVAPDDTIWVAHWGAGCVCRWDPQTGAMLERVETGCPHTSSCCLAPSGTLYITTSRLGLDEATLAAAPLSGALFARQT